MTAQEETSAADTGVPPAKETEDTGEGPSPGPAPAPAPPPAEVAGERMTTVNNIFNGETYAHGSVFGVTAANTDPPGSATGTLRHQEITAALGRYVEPPPYDSALRSLLADRVVALTGPPGIGKRAGAISLARQVTTGPLVVLSPVVSLKELADAKRRRYEARHAYLVIDWQGEPATTDTDFRLGLVREAVAAAEAFLIITCATPGGSPQAVHHVAWCCPDLAKVVRAHGDGVTTEALDTAAGLLPDEAPLSGVVAFARRIAAGDAPNKAMEVFDVTARQDVRAWFDAKPSVEEILEVTALTFVLGVTERRFESLLARLEVAMTPVLIAGEPVADTERPEPLLPQRRARRGGDGGLIRVDRVVTETSRGRIPVFAMPGYRRQVLAELWERYPVAFWDALRTWLDDIVEDEESLPVAQALALFAEIDLDEVQESYLERWSAAWPGQMTATHVLWFMCRDGLAPLALRIASRWAGQGSASQRWTASVAFSGELGRRYPVEAANRLWQLVLQGDDRRSEDACIALAGLYATLVDGTGGAGVVLVLLDRQLDGALANHTDPRRRTRAVRAALTVLSVADWRTGRSSVMSHLCRQPDRVDTVARLWAGTIRHRGFRRGALEALLDGLHSLAALSTRPDEDARALGEALAAALPDDERVALKQDFTTLQAHSRRKGDVALAHALLAALERIHRGGTT
jgi:hypothetical protein